MRYLLLAALALPGVAAAQSYQSSPAAARAVVARYYAAIDRGDYRSAYLLWDRGRQASGTSLAAFTRGFARTAHTGVRTGAPTDAEGAAGSSFITVPVQVDAVLKNGARQHYAGSYTLRRVNDIDGATPTQRRWHIASASLKPVR